MFRALVNRRVLATGGLSVTLAIIFHGLYFCKTIYFLVKFLENFAVCNQELAHNSMDTSFHIQMIVEIGVYYKKDKNTKIAAVCSLKTMYLSFHTDMPKLTRAQNCKDKWKAKKCKKQKKKGKCKKSKVAKKCKKTCKKCPTTVTTISKNVYNYFWPIYIFIYIQICWPNIKSRGLLMHLLDTM